MRRFEAPEPYIGSTGCGPLAYFITFPTYGSRLHGDERGTVDRAHNIFGEALLGPNSKLQRWERSRLRAASLVLNSDQRRVVHKTVEEVAEQRNWTLHAVNVRSNHVHVVVSADQPPEQVMNTFESWATRRLREAGLLPNNQRPWVRHGSTRYLWKRNELDSACRYVCEGQGDDLTM